jgi:hypothetical protein
VLEYKLLHTLSLLGVLSRTAWDRRANSIIDRQRIMQLQLDPKSIKLALLGRMASRWASLHADPRTAPSEGLEMCTHAAWVLKFHADICVVPKHLKLCVSFAVLQCLARLRLGWHHLQIRSDKIKRPALRLPRNERLCRLCSVEGGTFHAHHTGQACVEDVRHFLLECPAYQHLRVKYACVFGNAQNSDEAQSEHSRVLSVFDCDQQDQLAHVVYSMTVFRSHCLSLPPGTAMTVEGVQQIVDENVELVRIQ